MNKKLIAAAIAAVVAAPAVSAADTTLYGKAHVSIQSNSNVTPTSTADNYTVNSNASRIGVKGAEDLGDGLKAIFGYEMGYNITDGAPGTPISARNAYVGLTGGFGTVLAGRHDTPAKIAFYSAGTDFIGDSVVDMNSVAGSAGGGVSTFTEFRLNNAIAYVTPSFSGFTAAVAVVPGEGTSTVAANNNANGLADAYSLGLMYSGGGLKASLGYEVASKAYLNNGLPSATTQADHKMWQLGASYTFGDFTVGANYEKDDNYLSNRNMSRTAWGIAGKANFGNNYVVVNYGSNSRDQSGLATDPIAGTMEDAKGYGIGIGHKFSKRTQVYAAYHATNFDHAKTGGGTPATLHDQSNFALGMIHTF